MKKTKLCIIPLLFFSVVLSGCLKTRAQLREESREESNEARQDHAATPIQTVQDEPQGNSYAVDEMKGDLTQISGRLDELERAQKTNAVHDEVKQIKDRVQHIEETQAEILEQIRKLHEAPPATSQKDPSELFKQGKAQFEKGHAKDAAHLLGMYLKIPKPKNAEAAIFMRAESFYKLKEYKKAIVEYSKFPEKYPKSNHHPEALYKIAVCFEALGMKEDAQGFYQELTEKFPKSAEAKRVKKPGKKAKK